jgi:hypothetical protein
MSQGLRLQAEYAFETLGTNIIFKYPSASTVHAAIVVFRWMRV